MTNEEPPGTAPKLVEADILNQIVTDQYWNPPGTTMTVCVLTLRNGFNVTGESACVSPENFDPEYGAKMARKQAIDKIWQLEGYRLANVLHKARMEDEIHANKRLFEDPPLTQPMTVAGRAKDDALDAWLQVLDRLGGLGDETVEVQIDIHLNEEAANDPEYADEDHKAFCETRQEIIDTLKARRAEAREAYKRAVGEHLGDLWADTFREIFSSRRTTPTLSKD